jgi:hypothetical protein
MAVRKDKPVEVVDEIVVVEAWVDTIGGYTHSEMVIKHPEYHPDGWFERLKADGWTLTKYRRVEG